MGWPDRCQEQGPICAELHIREVPCSDRSRPERFPATVRTSLNETSRADRSSHKTRLMPLRLSLIDIRLIAPSSGIAFIAAGNR